MRKKLPAKIKKTPLIGSAFDYAKDPLKYYVDLLNRGEPLYYDSLLGKKFYIVYDGELIDEVFLIKHKNYVKNKFLKLFDDFFGEGLLTSDGEKWKGDRKIIQPSFSRLKIQHYSKMMIEETHFYLDSIQNRQKVFAMESMTQVTLSVSLFSVFGFRLNDEIYQSVLQTTIDCNEYLEKTASPFGFLTAKLPTSYRTKYLNGIDSFGKIIKKIIDDKKSEIEKGNAGNDLVTSLLLARDDKNLPLSDKALSDQIKTFLVAGHETSANTLSIALYVLGKNSTYQEKIFNELKDFDINDLEVFNKAEFLNQFINEVLRFYPTSSIIGRDALSDDTIGEYFIPKNAMITLPIWALHRNPKYYTDPETFNPERWTKEFIEALPKHAFVPFGYGPRICIGQMFAMSEFRIILGLFIKRFIIEIDPNYQLELSMVIMTKAKKDFEITLLKRTV